MAATWGERAFDLIGEITKQVLTLSTAIITISIAFAKDFALLASDSKKLLGGAWILFLLAIISGLLTLMASAGVQQKAAEGNQQPSINQGNIRIFGAAELILFALGMILSVWAGLTSVVR